MSSLSTAEQAARERVVGYGHDSFDAVSARVAAIAALDHPGLDVPSRVTMLPGDAVAVVEPGHDAPTLQAILDARGPLSAGECVWVGMAVADALAALHRAGVAHGAITASAVRLPSGGVLLGELIDASAGATAPDDVAALGRMLAACVTGPEAERVRAWTEPMTHSDPGARPTAAMVARALGSCARPEPVKYVPRGVASAMRASVRKSQSVRRLPQARWWRRRKLARTWLARALVAAAALAVVGGVWVGVSAFTASSAGAQQSGDSVPKHRDPDWVARQATRARFEALAGSDARSFLRWTEPGSPAREEATTTVEALESGRMVVDGLTASIDEAVTRTTDQGSSAVAVVRVTYTLSGHTVTIDGETTRFEPYSQTVDLTLVEASGEWLVNSAVDVTDSEGS